MSSDDDDERPTDPNTGWVRDHLHRYVATDGADGHEWRPACPRSCSPPAAAGAAGCAARP